MKVGASHTHAPHERGSSLLSCLGHHDIADTRPSCLPAFLPFRLPAFLPSFLSFLFGFSTGQQLVEKNCWEDAMCVLRGVGPRAWPVPTGNSKGSRRRFEKNVTAEGPERNTPPIQRSSSSPFDAREQ